MTDERARQILLGQWALALMDGKRNTETKKNYMAALEVAINAIEERIKAGKGET